MSTESVGPRDADPWAQQGAGDVPSATVVPMDHHRADMLAQAAMVRGRFRTILDTARAVLVDEPSPRLVRAAARRLTGAINQLAAEIAEERR